MPATDSPEQLRLLKESLDNCSEQETADRTLMRLFVAIDFADKIKDSLADLAQQLARQADSGRFVSRDNYHLTLAFIGETLRVNDVRLAMQQVAHCQLRQPLQLQLQGIGSFKAKGSRNARSYGEGTGQGSNDSDDGRSANARKSRNDSGGTDQGNGRRDGKDNRRARAVGTGAYTWWVGVKANPDLLCLAAAMADALREAGFALEHRSYKPHITLGRSVVTSKPVELSVPEAVIPVDAISLMKSDLSSGRPVYSEVYRT